MKITIDLNINADKLAVAIDNLAICLLNTKMSTLMTTDTLRNKANTAAKTARTKVLNKEKKDKERDDAAIMDEEIAKSNAAAEKAAADIAKVEADNLAALVAEERVDTTAGEAEESPEKIEVEVVPTKTVDEITLVAKAIVAASGAAVLRATLDSVIGEGVKISSAPESKYNELHAALTKTLAKASGSSK